MTTYAYINTTENLDLFYLSITEYILYTHYMQALLSYINSKSHAIIQGKKHWLLHF